MVRSGNETVTRMTPSDGAISQGTAGGDSPVSSPARRPSAQWRQQGRTLVRHGRARFCPGLQRANGEAETLAAAWKEDGSSAQDDVRSYA
jgi:hypothetical protein